MAILKSDSGDISYTLTRQKGMKNMRIRIKDDRSICVSTNPNVPLAKIENFIQKNSQWIVRNVGEKNSAADRSIENGTKLKIFGEILTVELRQDGDEDAVCDGERLIVTASDIANQAHVRQLLIGFIAQRGRTVLSRHYRFFLERCGYMGQPPMLVLKALKSKWGHCDYKNNQIMLNFALCGLPEELAAYVAAHEVAHLLVRNHSSDFYKVGESIYPGFNEYNRLLKQYNTNLWANIIA